MCLNRSYGSSWLGVLIVTAGTATGQTIEVRLTDRTITGHPVSWDDQQVTLLSRDGQYVSFAPDDARSFRQVAGDFRSLSQAELRGGLLREFGDRFEVSGTGQYLVVHPVGERDRWADRFEQLYRSMLHYFTARGFRLGRPEFPLVAIVFPEQAVYLQYIAQQTGSRVSGNSLGYYDPTSNRIHLFDITARQPDSSLWYVNAETIIHEAAHQTAFNVGIHRRHGANPAWVVEGLGTMFESRGVWDSHHFPTLKDRVNPSQLKAYRQLVPPQRSLEILQVQLSSDQLFGRMPDLAYAHAWALSFFLTEQEPRQYRQFLTRTYARPAFQPVTAGQRVKEFTDSFGADLKMLDARLQRFVASLPD